MKSYSFEPTIVQGLGYTAARAQLMSVPPFAVSFCCKYLIPTSRTSDSLDTSVALISAFLSDRYHCRGLTSILCGVLCLIGFSMFLGQSELNSLPSLGAYDQTSHIKFHYRLKFKINPICLSLLLHNRNIRRRPRSLHMELQQRLPACPTCHRRRPRFHNDELGWHPGNLATGVVITCSSVYESFHRICCFLCGDYSLFGFEFVVFVGSE